MTKKCLGLWTKTPKLGKIIMLLLYSTQLCRLIFVSLFNYSSTIFVHFHSTKETNGLNLSLTTISQALTMYLTFSAYSMIRLLVCHTYDVMCSLCTLLALAVCKGRSNRK